ncbi:hypothetical protein AAG906_037476 [Vitis piasezkii]
MAALTSILLFLLLIAMAAALAQGQGTRVGFYSYTCPEVESIVKETVTDHFNSNPTIAPGLLRMHFHDCFVRGCDASILLTGSSTERTAGPNSLLRGYEVIDDAKTRLEAACPGVTKRASWKGSIGQRDGRVSLASEITNLPAFCDSIELQKQKFVDKGLNDQDLVALVGGHTIGTSACQFFRDRLYNFNTTTGSGADPAFLPQLQALCPQNGDASRHVALSISSPNTFDAFFFKNLKSGRGILQLDQKLWEDASTRSYVQRFLGIRGLQGLNFNVEFGRSMVKMSNIGVKTGTEGEIRRVCSAIN